MKRWLTIACLMVASCGIAPAQQDIVRAPAAVASVREPSLPPEDFAGCWQEVTAPDHYLLLEADRLRELHFGELSFARVVYDIDHFVRINWSRRQRCDLSFEGELLVVASGEISAQFRSVAADAVPAALEPKTLPFAAAATLPAERIAALQAEFVKRREIDQAVRTDASRHGEMEAVDRDNTEWLAKLAQEIGWIDVGRFGADAAGAAFLIVQHSGDLPLMQAALPLIEHDVRQNGLDGQNYALLFDRLQVNLGRRQRYGSQLGSDETGRLVVISLEDRDNVEQLRKGLKMQPLKGYLEFFRNGPPPKQVIFEDDLPE